MYEIIAQYIALFWAVTIAPYNFSVLIRATVFDRGYSYGLYDIMTGSSIFVLVVTGLPPISI